MLALLIQILFLYLFCSGANAAPIIKSRQAKPAYFILAGDSTTAKQRNGSGGWGDGFLKVLKPPASGENLGHNGRTTVDYRSGGDWATVIKDVKSNKDGKDVYVTIQFGHNDQQANSGISNSQFQRNLGVMAQEVKAAGGIPILVTPLSRRYFNGGQVRETLANEARATIAAADAGGFLWIDLHGKSKDYLNKIGPGGAAQFNPKSDDTTHLTPRGTTIFGRMVADLIAAKVPKLKGSFESG